MRWILNALGYLISHILGNIIHFAAMLIFICFALAFLGNGIIWLTEFQLTWALFCDSMVFILIGLGCGGIALLLGIGIFSD